MSEYDKQPADLQQPALNYEYLHHLLVPLGAINSPAELQGMLIGQLTGAARPDADAWQGQVLEFLDLAEAPGADILEVLQRFKTESLAQLDEGFGFQLMLPDDDADFVLRAQALAEFCHGFLSGFGRSGISADSELSSDVAETLRDFAAIVQMDTQDEELDACEQSLFELSEYVRMGVVSMFMEFNRGADGEIESSTLH